MLCNFLIFNFFFLYLDEVASNFSETTEGTNTDDEFEYIVIIFCVYVNTFILFKWNKIQ